MNRDVLRSLAAEAFAAWDAVFDAAPAVDRSDADCAEFADQFRVDVSGISDDQRSRLGAALGPASFGFVQAVYVEDQGSRLRSALRQLFGVADCFATRAGAVSQSALWPAIEEMLAAVVRLDALDPLTSELVRLRGANAHHCRLCMSRRDVTAMSSDEGALLERVERYESAGFDDRRRTALRLTDAILWQPEEIPADVLTAVRGQLSEAEALEVVLDVTRNASNKIAVALGADQPVVGEGFEYFAIAPDGAYTYGLPAPPPRTVV